MLNSKDIDGITIYSNRMIQLLFQVDGEDINQWQFLQHKIKMIE